MNETSTPAVYTEICVCASTRVLDGFDKFLSSLVTAQALPGLRVAREDHEVSDLMSMRINWSLACQHDVDMGKLLKQASFWLLQFPQAVCWIEAQNDRGAHHMHLFTSGVTIVEQWVRQRVPGGMRQAVSGAYDQFTSLCLAMHNLIPDIGEEDPSLIQTMLTPGGTLRQDKGVSA